MTAIILSGLLAATVLRKSVLREIGWALVMNNAVPKSADVIVLSIDSKYPAVLTAADLFHQGVAPKVALFANPTQPWEQEFVHRGVSFVSEENELAGYLDKLGVKQVEIVPRSVAGSEDEATALPSWCDQHNFRSLVIVTTPDHSRRLGRILRRAMNGRSVLISIQSAQYSGFDPDHWWESRGGVRIVIVEVQKLVLDMLVHPIDAGQLQ
jgi:uncharacterized SAM-binding protein YcdF (DUF218 family)